MFTHREQLAHGEKLVAVAGKWATTRDFDLKKTIYAKTIAAAVSAVQDGGSDALSFDEIRQLLEELVKVE